MMDACPYGCADENTGYHKKPVVNIAYFPKSALGLGVWVGLVLES